MKYQSHGVERDCYRGRGRSREEKGHKMKGRNRKGDKGEKDKALFEETTGIIIIMRTTYDRKGWIYQSLTFSGEPAEFAFISPDDPHM